MGGTLGNGLSIPLAEDGEAEEARLACGCMMGSMSLSLRPYLS